MRPPLPPEYAELQLRFARRFVELGLGEMRTAVLELTNFHRRFGLGDPDDGGADASWQRYVDGLDARRSLADQVAWTVEFAADPMSGITPPRRNAIRAGPFRAHVDDGVLRTHFVPEPSEDVSPLHASQRSLRRRELDAVITQAIEQDPQIHVVRGVSWLYNTNSYRSLFPRQHIATAKVLTGTTKFQGSSSWGQFLDHRGDVNHARRDRFLDALTSFDGAEPWTVFPLPTLVVESPIEIFTAQPSADRRPTA